MSSVELLYTDRSGSPTWGGGGGGGVSYLRVFNHIIPTRHITPVEQANTQDKIHIRSSINASQKEHSQVSHLVERSIGEGAVRCEYVPRLHVGLNHGLNVGLGDRGGRAKHGTTRV